MLEIIPSNRHFFLFLIFTYCYFCLNGRNYAKIDREFFLFLGTPIMGNKINQLSFHICRESRSLTLVFLSCKEIFSLLLLDYGTKLQH